MQKGKINFFLYTLHIFIFPFDQYSVLLDFRFIAKFDFTFRVPSAVLVYIFLIIISELNSFYICLVSYIFNVRFP